VHYRARARGNAVAGQWHQAARGRRAGRVRGEAPETHSRGRAADREQHPHDPHHRRQLWRALGHRAGDAVAAAGAPRDRQGPEPGHRGGAGPAHGAGPCPRAGSLHPHRRRAAHQQFHALAARLHRVLFHRHLLAGLRARRAGKRTGVVSRSRAALRPHQRAGGYRLMLLQRVITAFALLLLLLPTILLAAPLAWGLVSLGFLAVAAAEWARLLQRPASALMVAAAVLLAGLAWLFVPRPVWAAPALCAVVLAWWIVFGVG